MLLNSAVSSGNALRSSSVDAAAEARDRVLSARLWCVDTHSSDTGVFFWTALTIAIRHSRITPISSMPAWTKAVENPAFAWGADACPPEFEEGSVSVV